MGVIDLTSLSPSEINALVDESDATQRGYIEPGIQKAVDSGDSASNMSEIIKWPKNKAKAATETTPAIPATPKTVEQQVTALNQNIKNHHIKVLEGKATAWPELEVYHAPAKNGNEPFAMLVNQTALKAAIAKAEAEAAKAK